MANVHDVFDVTISTATPCGLRAPNADEPSVADGRLESRGVLSGYAGGVGRKIDATFTKLIPPLGPWS